ncbi:MAG: SDR family oxidoreductase [Pseudomonadota bacterium]
MDLGISGKTAIVCASSRGLGKGSAMALAQAGCRVIVNGRDEDVLTATASEIAEATGSEVVPVSGDVSDPAVQDALLTACPEPDILVNNNGGPPRRDYRDLNRQDMINGVVQNMVTPLELIQKTLDGMSERGFGRIVNITSLSVYMPIEGLDLSSGARAGLTAFLAGVCRNVGSNVTINNILPGKMDTDRLQVGLKMGAKARNTTFEEESARQINEIPAGRFGNAEEFGNACAFLCSAHAGYITGQNLIVDGGLYTSSF